MTDVGAYTGATSPDGAYDMGGNVLEWTETLSAMGRAFRGGSWIKEQDFQAAFFSYGEGNPTSQEVQFGFRLALVEPLQLPAAGPVATGLLAMFLAATGIAFSRVRRG